MRIITKTLSELTDKEYKDCWYLNMRGSGMMMYSLMDNKKSPRSYAIMAYGGSKLLGWALLVPFEDEVGWFPTNYQRRHAKFVTQFYVRKSWRNKGIGSELMSEVKKIEPVPVVIPHDPTSGNFFASHKVITDKYRRSIITKAKKRKGRAA